MSHSSTDVDIKVILTFTPFLIGDLQLKITQRELIWLCNNFNDNHIRSKEDDLALSEKNMEELKLPIGIRNSIKAAQARAVAAPAGHQGPAPPPNPR